MNGSAGLANSQSEAARTRHLLPRFLPLQAQHTRGETSNTSTPGSNTQRQILNCGRGSTGGKELRITNDSRRYNPEKPCFVHKRRGAVRQHPRNQEDEHERPNSKSNATLQMTARSGEDEDEDWLESDLDSIRVQAAMLVPRALAGEVQVLNHGRYMVQ